MRKMPGKVAMQPGQITQQSGENDLEGQVIEKGWAVKEIEGEQDQRRLDGSRVGPHASIPGKPTQTRGASPAQYQDGQEQAETDDSSFP